ncbi:HU family DNA-binding protein [Pseudorhodobacter sp.]|uniref:HU family DNA-binding protein n=1 Tax=Pseudorhodobacter sp. TaxID=1934400 RepID=UPI002649C31A|nr:HU family DNA-binding protein [Pseudorhodobacter sp.]MDN5785543.1 HU family DNA-binding protein [Pseudorhodobacter sp.]
MTTRKTTTDKTDQGKKDAAKTPAVAKPAAKTSAKPAMKPVVKLQAPQVTKIQPAEVVVPKLSVVGNAPTPLAAEAAKADGDENRMMKKQEFVERVVKATGAKKKDVKLILEAALGVLGDALSAGEELNLPPLGKTKVNRQKIEGNAEVLILKLRRGTGNAGGGNDDVKQGLAEDGEDD